MICEKIEGNLPLGSPNCLWCRSCFWGQTDPVPRQEKLNVWHLKAQKNNNHMLLYHLYLKIAIFCSCLIFFDRNLPAYLGRTARWPHRYQRPQWSDRVERLDMAHWTKMQHFVTLKFDYCWLLLTICGYVLSMLFCEYLKSGDFSYLIEREYRRSQHRQLHLRPTGFLHEPSGVKMPLWKSCLC